MRTTIIGKRWGGNSYRRTGPLSEIPDNKGHAMHSVFIKAHDAEVFGFSMDTLKTSKGYMKHYPDQVLLGSECYNFERGKLPKLRIIDEEFVKQIDDLDQRISALQKERDEAIEDAYLRGRAVTLAEAREWFTRPKAETV